MTYGCKLHPPPSPQKTHPTPQEGLLTVWPWKVLTGLSWPSLHTWMHMSVLHEANVLLLCQSTSRAGAVGEKVSWELQWTGSKFCFTCYSDFPHSLQKQISKGSLCKGSLNLDIFALLKAEQINHKFIFKMHTCSTMKEIKIVFISIRIYTEQGCLS